MELFLVGTGISDKHVYPIFNPEDEISMFFGKLGTRL
jgi:hypothetical protein